MFNISKDNGIWIGDPKNKHKHDEGLCSGLVDFFTNELTSTDNIVDLGCGLGDYVKKLKLENLNIDGFDGNPDTEFLSGGIAHVLDLSKPFNFNNPYTWVISLEVAEH